MDQSQYIQQTKHPSQGCVFGAAVQYSGRLVALLIQYHSTSYQEFNMAVVSCEALSTSNSNRNPVSEHRVRPGVFHVTFRADFVLCACSYHWSA